MKILPLLLLFVVGCGPIASNSADKDQRLKTEKSLAEANKQIGMPAITNFQERRLAKMIFELRDQEDLTTYAYIVSMTGDLVFLGRCTGFGLPYSVQFTNPERVLGGNEYPGAGPGGTIPQADPNGLFMPSGLSATWLMMFDEESGESRPVYIEQEIIVSPFKLHAKKVVEK
jgi:hypothetical protein